MTIWWTVHRGSFCPTPLIKQTFLLLSFTYIKLISIPYFHQNEFYFKLLSFSIGYYVQCVKVVNSSLECHKNINILPTFKLWEEKFSHMEKLLIRVFKCIFRSLLLGFWLPDFSFSVGSFDWSNAETFKPLKKHELACEWKSTAIFKWKLNNNFLVWCNLILQVQTKKIDNSCLYAFIEKYYKW